MTPHSLLRELIDISKVDFTNMDEVMGFGALILSDANRCGLADGTASRQSREVIQIVETARRWIGGVRYILPDLSAADAFRLVDIYDFIHRVAIRRPADSAFLDGLILNAFHARVHGDHSVDEYRLYHAIDIQIRRKNRAFLGKPLQWLTVNLDRWYKNFNTSNWRKLADYDIIRQSGILIAADKFIYEGEAVDFKRDLFESARQYLDRTEGMTLPELEALSKFLNASAGLISPEEYRRHDEALTAAIIAHPSTDPRYRQSLELSLSLTYV